MYLSYEWLSEYIDLRRISARQLADLLTNGGIEVESLTPCNKGVHNVVVGEVKEKVKHPNADKLSVCMVSIGTKEDLQIVCGAPNIEAGQKVCVAVIGAVLPGNFKIKKTKLRGIESQGMICSAKELGINEKWLSQKQQMGIMVLPDHLEVGVSIPEVLGLDDFILELALTPNRGDCLSLFGAAYEVSALIDRPLKIPQYKDSLNIAEPKMIYPLQVSMENKEHCSDFAVCVIKNVTVNSSPLWLQKRLISVGIRPTNNIVDITNYVMLEYGQPLHPYDAKAITGESIIVRDAVAGETLQTLDGVKRTLSDGMLVVADKSKILSMAGIMGGTSAQITEQTTDIILEAALFSASSVRKTSRQIGIRSEASSRFEKGIDPARMIPALHRAAALIGQYANGTIVANIREKSAIKRELTCISLQPMRVNQLLGTEISAKEMKKILERLHFSVDIKSEQLWQVIVPSRRSDIKHEVDLVEEIARLYGYNKIPTTLIQGPTTVGELSKEQEIARKIRAILTRCSLHEAITYSMTSQELSALFPQLAKRSQPISVAMPISEERSILRTMLLPSLLEAASYNFHHKNEKVALFEIANVYHSQEASLASQPEEKPRLAMLLSGKKTSKTWNETVASYDFYDLKGVIQALMQQLGLNRLIHFKADKIQGFHPGRTASISFSTEEGLQNCGYIGQVHPKLEHRFDLPPTFVAELELQPLYKYAEALMLYRFLPRYPAITRDIAVVVDRKISSQQIMDTILASAGSQLESVHIFDVYTGERIEQSKKSLAFALVYRNVERTLTDEEVNEIQLRIFSELMQTYQAELRE